MVNNLKHKGLWVTTITLEPAFHGNGVFTNDLTSRLSKYFSLDLLYYPQDRSTIRPLNLNQFKNIFYIEKEKSFIPPVLTDNGTNSNGNLINKSILDWLKNNFKKNSYDFIVCDYIFLSSLFDVLPNKITKIINTHDEWGDRHIGLKWSDELKKKSFCVSAIEELISFRKSDLLITISNKEEKVFEERLRSIKKNVSVKTVNYCPNTNDNYKCSKPKDNLLKIGFIASNNHLNVSGINEFIECLSKFNCQNIELHLAGLICEDVDYSYDWIIKKGILDEAEISKFYEDVNLVVNPMPTKTTGLKIKSIMALICGMPIIGTEDAFSGLIVKSKWHLINDIESLANEVYTISKDLKIINEIKNDSEKLGNSLLMNSELQINNLVTVIKKKIRAKKIKQNYINKKGLIKNKYSDSELDETEKFNYISHLTSTNDCYQERLSKVIKHQNNLLDKNNKLKEKINFLKNKIENFSKKAIKGKDLNSAHLKEQLDKRTFNNMKLREEIVHLKDQLNKRTIVNKNLKKVIDKFLIDN